VCGGAGIGRGLLVAVEGDEGRGCGRGMAAAVTMILLTVGVVAGIVVVVLEVWEVVVVVVLVGSLNEALTLVEGLGRLEASTRGRGLRRRQALGARTHAVGRRGAAPAVGVCGFVFDYDGVVLEDGGHVVAEREAEREGEKRETWTAISLWRVWGNETDEPTRSQQSGEGWQSKGQGKKRR
jgi:hypothetical protein